MIITGATRRAKLQSKCHHQQTNTRCIALNGTHIYKVIIYRHMQYVEMDKAMTIIYYLMLYQCDGYNKL